MASDGRPGGPSLPLMTLTRMRIVFIGTGEIGVPTLRALLDSEHEVVGMVTQPDKPVGREQRIEPPPIKKVITRSGDLQIAGALDGWEVVAP